MRYDHKVQRDRNAHSRNVCNARTRNACVTCALRSQWERYLTKWTCGVGGGGRKWPTNCANRKSCKAQACTLSASLRSCHLTNHLQSAVHILHFACLAAGQLITCQSLNLQSCHTCYTTLDMGQWRGRSKHRADLESNRRALWPDHVAVVPGTARVLRVLPDAARFTTTHAADWHGPGAEAAGTDLTLMFQCTD